MGKHLFIAGHGKRRNGTFDPGATGLIPKGEHRYMSEDLFPAMKKFLPKNHNVVFFDEYNVFDHGNIVALAKKHNADQVTEFHFDAASASASGGHVIIYSGYSPDSMDLALRDAIDDMVGVRYNHRGHQGISGRNNLANVNRTADAGVTYRLVELGFGTNKDDAKVLTEDVERYAKRLVEAITGTSNSKAPKKQTSVPKQQTKTSFTKSSKTSGDLGLVDWMKAQKMDSSFSNRKKLAGQHGIKNYKGTASQNTQLLDKLKGSSGKSASSSSGSLPNTRYWVKSPASARFSGSGVRKVQEALASVYYYPNKGAKNNGVDGWYGPDTADAVKRFQSMHGLTEDGIYGPATRSKLMEVSPLY